ncbi:MAG: DUF6364 family protein [Anaerolineales bacterium]
MKTRITLTMDPKVTRRAKRIAHERNTSVSALVEELVRSASLASEKEPPFVRKWAGKFRVRQTSRPDPRRDALRARYGLDKE